LYLKLRIFLENQNHAHREQCVMIAVQIDGKVNHEVRLNKQPAKSNTTYE